MDLNDAQTSSDKNNRSRFTVHIYHIYIYVYARLLSMYTTYV